MTTKAESFVTIPSFSNREREQWYIKFDKTGFNLRNQVNKFEKDTRFGIGNGISFCENRDVALKNTLEDVNHFWLEYIKRCSVLPIKVEKKNINGKTKIICIDYGNIPLEETVLPEERNGAVRTAVESVISHLQSAKKDSTAIIISPAGWSGLKNESGKPIFHSESQIYYFHISEEGKIEALTIRTNLSLTENETLMGMLSGRTYQLSSEATERQRIVDIVGNPVFIEKEEFGPGKIVEDLVKIRNGYGNIFEQKTFLDMKNDLQNLKQILETSSALKEKTAVFKTWVTQSVNVIDEDSLCSFAVRLGKTIIELSEIDINQKINPQQTYATCDYGGGADRLSERTGCNGGGSEESRNTNNVNNSESKAIRYHCGACKKYGQLGENERCSNSILSISLFDSRMEEKDDETGGISPFFFLGLFGLIFGLALNSK